MVMNSSLLRALMRYISFFHCLILMTLLQVGTAYASQPVCHDFCSKIEPDMQRQETDFTPENYRRSQQMLDKTIPDWMEKAFEHNKKFSNTYDQLFQGDIWLAHANATAMVKGYVLKLEYITATPDNKETARKAFCKIVAETPYYD